MECQEDKIHISQNTVKSSEAESRDDSKNVNICSSSNTNEIGKPDSKSKDKSVNCSQSVVNLNETKF